MRTPGVPRSHGQRAAALGWRREIDVACVRVAGSRAAVVVVGRTQGGRRWSTLGASPTPEEELCPSCSMPPAAVAHPSRCRSSTPAGRRATRGCATPPTRAVRARRWSPSIARSGANATTGGGKAAPCPPPALAGITGDEPGGERLADAPFIAKQRRRRRKRPSSTARRSTHAASRRTTPGRREQQRDTPRSLATHADHPAAERVRVRDALLGRLARLDGRHWQPQALDLAHEVPAQPLGCLLRQRRDDDLVEVPVADGVLDRGERVGTADEPLYRATGRAPKHRHGVLERPIGSLAVGDVRDKQRELARAALPTFAYLLQQAGRRRRAVRHDEYALLRLRLHFRLL